MFFVLRRIGKVDAGTISARGQKQTAESHVRKANNTATTIAVVPFTIFCCSEQIVSRTAGELRVKLIYGQSI